MTDMTIILEGTFFAKSPVHIVPPFSRSVNVSPHADANECAYRLRYHNGEWKKVACVTSSTFRGGLRRAAVNEAWGLAADAPNKPTIDDYVYGAVGGVKGKEKETVETVATRARRRALNPVVGLFGASTPWDAGRAITPSLEADPDFIDRDAYAREGDVKPSQMIGARRSDDMTMSHGLQDLLSGDPLDRWNEMRSQTKKDIEVQRRIDELEKERRQASPEERPKIENSIKKEKDKLSGSNSLLLPFAHQVMPAGTPLTQKIVLKNVSEVEAGLFLAAIDRLWSENPAFGGKKSHGYGLIEGGWDVKLKVGRRTEDAGKITVAPYEGIDVDQSEEAQRLIKVWDDHLAAVKSGEAEMDLRQGDV